MYRVRKGSSRVEITKIYFLGIRARYLELGQMVQRKTLASIVKIPHVASTYTGSSAHKNGRGISGEACWVFMHLG